jgi:hypothetical protein
MPRVAVPLNVARAAAGLRVDVASSVLHCVSVPSPFTLVWPNGDRVPITAPRAVQYRDCRTIGTVYVENAAGSGEASLYYSADVLLGKADAADIGSLPRYFAIVPDDDDFLPNVTRGLYVGTAGDVRVLGELDTVAVTLPNLAAGIWHPMRVLRVYATGTTATDIVGGF